MSHACTFPSTITTTKTITFLKRWQKGLQEALGKEETRRDRQTDRQTCQIPALLVDTSSQPTVPVSLLVGPAQQKEGWSAERGPHSQRWAVEAWAGDGGQAPERPLDQGRRQHETEAGLLPDCCEESTCLVPAFAPLLSSPPQPREKCGRTGEHCIQESRGKRSFLLFQGEDSISHSA